MADFGGVARYGSFGFSIGSKGYIGTGYARYPLGLTRDFWEYDPTTNIWTQKAHFGGDWRYYGVGFAIGSLGYAGTGSKLDRLNWQPCGVDLWEYDPNTDIWTQKTDMPIVDGVVQMYAFIVGDKGYVGSGTSSFWSGTYWTYEYDPSTDTWTQKADMIKVQSISNPAFLINYRWAATGFAIGKYGYAACGAECIGGPDQHMPMCCMCSVARYDPNSNSWSQVQNFGGTRRRKACSFVIGGSGFVATGHDNIPRCCGDLWKYTPSMVGERTWFTGGLPHRPMH
jgi:hypothetical protein